MVAHKMRVSLTDLASPLQGFGACDLRSPGRCPGLLRAPLLMLCIASSALSVPFSPGAEEAIPRDDPVVATVGEESVRAGEVARVLGTFTQGKEMSAAAKPVFQAQALEEVVDRRLVLAYAAHSAAPSSEEIRAGVSQFAAGLARQGKSADDFRKAQSMTEADFERQIAWNLVWEKLRAKYVTDERVASYFQSHRRELDGTRMLVSHILLRPPPNAGPSNGSVSAEGLVREARSLRQEIASGRISFADAARQRSQGPSAKDGGRLGWIGRRGPMDESFSRAAFALEAGDVSEPVRSPFGVHLIRCDEIKPGGKPLREVRDAVEEGLARELLEKLSRYQRQYTPVGFTGKWPHFKPGTSELAPP